MRIRVTTMLAVATLLSVASCHRIAEDLSEYEASCEAWCEHLHACKADDPASYPTVTANSRDCIDNCINDVPEGQECVDDDIEYSYCLVSMSCDQLAYYYEDPFDDRLNGLCEAELWASSACK